MRGLPNAGGHPKAAAFSFIGFDNFHIYFKSLETITSYNNFNPKIDLSLPSNLEYVFKEVQEYRSSVRQSILKLNDRMYNINLAYVPIHYHNRVINSYYDDMMICLIWYHFESRIWYITIKSINNINLKKLFFQDNQMDIRFLDDNYLEWKLNELKNTNITTYII
jgi:hypothetical protein